MEAQPSQQPASGSVVRQRGCDDAGEAVGAGAVQGLDREGRADPLSLEIVCDFDRDIGDVWFVGQLDIVRSGDE